MSGTETLLLSRADLVALLDPSSVVEAVAAGFRAYSSGGTATPIRIHLAVPGSEGIVLVMPCAVRDPAIVGTKIAAIYRGNAARGLPTVTSTYVLSDPRNGLALAVMDGTYLTAIRTAAASAVATRALARSESRVLGILGTGTLADSHLRVLTAVHPYERVLVWGRTEEATRRWVASRSGEGLPPILAAASAEALVAASDVLVTATTSTTPLFDGALVRPGTHVNATGAFAPKMREVDGNLVARAAVFADTLAGAQAEAGDLLLAVEDGLITLAHLRAEIGEVLLGEKPGRQSDDEITFFESVGAAFEDAVTAQLAYQRALDRGIGARFAFL